MKALVHSVALAVAMTVAGCAIKSRMDIRDLVAYPVDCANKYAHLKFLEFQLPSSNEQVVKGQFDRDYEAAVKTKIWDLQSRCEDIRR